MQVPAVSSPWTCAAVQVAARASAQPSSSCGRWLRHATQMTPLMLSTSRQQRRCRSPGRPAALAPCSESTRPPGRPRKAPRFMMRCGSSLLLLPRTYLSDCECNCSETVSWRSRVMSTVAAWFDAVVEYLDTLPWFTVTKAPSGTFMWTRGVLETETVTCTLVQQCQAHSTYGWEPVMPVENGFIVWHKPHTEEKHRHQEQTRSVITWCLQVNVFFCAHCSCHVYQDDFFPSIQCSSVSSPQFCGGKV